MKDPLGVEDPELSPSMRAVRAADPDLILGAEVRDLKAVYSEAAEEETEEATEVETEEETVMAQVIEEEANSKDTKVGMLMIIQLREDHIREELMEAQGTKMTRIEDPEEFRVNNMIIEEEKTTIIDLHIEEMVVRDKDQPKAGCHLVVNTMMILKDLREDSAEASEVVSVVEIAGVIEQDSVEESAEVTEVEIAEVTEEEIAEDTEVAKVATELRVVTEEEAEEETDSTREMMAMAVKE
jgi:hypothetical protein